MRYEAYTGFNPEKIAEYFKGRDWSVRIIPLREVGLVTVTKGAPLECGDGRFDLLEGRDLNSKQQEVRGVRILGGVNAIMALLTGGDEIGFQRATELLRRVGVTPGTHSDEGSGCGFANLWINGELKSAIYPYKLHETMDRGGLRLGRRLQELMCSHGGKHHRLNGNHNEKGTRLNPFRRLTEAAGDGSRFRIDDWFMADLGIPDEIRWFKIAETIEKLKPEAAKLEIIAA